MTAGKRDHQTALVGGRSVLSFVAALVLAHGCTIVPNASSDPQPDLDAIATVITDAYRSGGSGRPVLFLDTGQACDSISPSCGSPVEGVPPSLKTRLEANLHVKVRPESDACRDDETLPVLTPVSCDTREVGVVVEIKGYRREDAKEKKSTMATYWVPGVNHLKTYGRWMFAEFCDVYAIESDFEAKVEAEFNKMITAATSDSSAKEGHA